MREIKNAGEKQKEETGNGSLLNGFNNSCKICFIAHGSSHGG